MKAKPQPRKLTVKEAVLARMALGAVANALQLKKAIRRARRTLSFKPTARATAWRLAHPGLSRICAHGWRGMGNPEPLYRPLCTKRNTLGRRKMAEAQRHNVAKSIARMLGLRR